MNNVQASYRHAKVLVTAFERWLGAIVLRDIAVRSWASATFVGTRLTLTCVMADDANVALFRAEVPETDFPLRAAFVADIDVGEPSRVREDALELVVEVLVIDDG